MRPFLLALATLATTLGAVVADDAPLNLHKRVRVPSVVEPAAYETVETTARWEPSKTALIVCDMWDDHWCKGATRRCGELAPVLNQVVADARAKGVLIVHSPSGCMDFYKDHPARLRAKSAPKAADLPKDIGSWCYKIPAEERGTYPIDQSDGGCDCGPRCTERNAWTSQDPRIEIRDEDAISDSGEEVWNLLASRGIEHVMLTGVHTNMCVLGRPFGLRNLAKNGKDVVLVRDLTDTMYNSRRPPYVSHFEGTNRIVEHIEKFVCPTIVSTDLTGRPAFAFRPDDRPRAVFVIGDDEYRTAETLPAFAQAELEPNGVRCTFVVADPKAPNDFPGVEALDDADLLFVSARRRAPTDEQMKIIRRYVESGKPVVGIRTASHAFDAKGQAPAGHAEWTTFDPDVLGGHYTGHHQNGVEPTIALAPEAKGHAILDSVEPGFRSPGSLYKASPLAPTTIPLLTGAIDGHPAEPVAWINLKGRSRVFYTSLGDPGDFETPAFRRLLLNAVFWALDRPAPGAKAPAPTSFQVPDDLAVDLAAAEPIVRQPLHLSFDERGRLWVVQYAQYPHPAGLKMLSRDGVWRVAYDKVPVPPPNHVRGLDRITIHEDVDGDGAYDRHKTFVEGLNLATSVARGRGGVWVLNPPYLLFYPDRDGDDVPDGDPEVHLQGFGLEDTHSIANSLTWGPDGWLYAAQGSTVSGRVSRPGLDDGREPVRSLGQLIWRYHPEQRRYEIFAEGGGNAFGVEVDAKGRIYSGHNGGDTRGFAYVQGGYFQKGFDKHGPLSNPYTFGYFPAMTHGRTPRFTHDFAIYEGGRFPEKYQGALFGVAPLLNHVVISELSPEGSTFRTRDVGLAMSTTEPQFRPVDVTLGPDGFLHVADWYDEYVSHLRNNAGLVSVDTGRIYRIRPRDAKPTGPLLDLGRLSSPELVDRLDDPNRWVRQTALRLIGDRKDAGLAPLLRRRIESTTGQSALESLWALNLVGGLDEPSTLAAIRHDDPYVRSWAIRLACDDGEVSREIASGLVATAETEPRVEVRSQLASSARRLPTPDALAIVDRLMTRGEDATDPHVPLLIWWAVEAKVGTDPEAVLAMFRDREAWEAPIAVSTIQERLMRRFAAAGGRKDLDACVRLLEAAPGPEHVARLMTGLEAAYLGRSTAGLPPRLADALEQHGGSSIVLGLRRAKPEAVAEALRALGDPGGDREKPLQYLRVLGEVRIDACRPAILELARTSPVNPLRSAALSALAVYDDPEIADEVMKMYTSLPDDVLASAWSLLASRRAWAATFLDAAVDGRVDARAVPREVVDRFRALKDPKVDELAVRAFGPAPSDAPADLKERMAKFAGVARSGGGTPKAGRAIFQERCERCHTLFGKGGNVGPELTTFRRDDLDSLLLAVVDPSAEVREGYVAYTLATTDGRVLTGVRADEDPHVVVLRCPDGEERTIAREDVEAFEPSKTSIMPPGLLDDLTDDQVRDLFSYLRVSQPIID
ncbi:PVC-type heme-binding CxxCH protein [Planctomyces sp. SH-PL62]|uniref:PVC-type heme-binding CxxCH protein n=1 Tax=Planctomyces sp. SH-PL62 TaxID=1636152 RepID=UPI00078C488A|nr:PVC-type heme-binding CxxCH protein [Planctomyces sp. SH-PL62]AMV37764.1 Trehalose utilization [Planctomyces sp. SH-PL62]